MKARQRDAVPGWARALPYRMRRVWDPAVFQGGGKHNDYFEGWYVKCVSAGGAEPIAFIPGISRDDAGGTSHSFVQVVRPGGATNYLQYPVEQFHFDPHHFAVTVGPNHFSAAGAKLALDCEGIKISGELRFGPLRPWPVQLLTPGIMGWYRFVPGMECYHGVVSLDHAVDGELVIDGATVSFDRGRGYIEKDWGRSFPSSWVWAQSNHFKRQHVSVSASVAKIPWMGNSFVGFIAGVLIDEELYRFTTYTGAKLTAFESRYDGAKMTYEDNDYRLDVELEGAVAAPLKAPEHGRMVARADESLNAEMLVKLKRKRDGVVLLEDCGLHAGCEVMDAKGELVTGVWHPKESE
jgi:tocopherol cyclase